MTSIFFSSIFFTWAEIIWIYKRHHICSSFILHFQVLCQWGSLYCFFFTTWAQSYFPRTTLSFTPGKSWVLPPSTSTTLCSCRLCPSPGINATASFPLESRTRAHFLFAELGFFGFRIIVLSTTALSWGQPNVALRDLGGGLGFPWRCIWLRVAIVL